MPDMYKDIEKIMKKANENHFGFDGMQDYRNGSIYRISIWWFL